MEGTTYVQLHAARYTQGYSLSRWRVCGKKETSVWQHWHTVFAVERLLLPHSYRHTLLHSACFKVKSTSSLYAMLLGEIEKSQCLKQQMRIP